MKAARLLAAFATIAAVGLACGDATATGPSARHIAFPRGAVQATIRQEPINDDESITFVVRVLANAIGVSAYQGTVTFAPGAFELVSVDAPRGPDSHVQNVESFADGRMRFAALTTTQFDALNTADGGEAFRFTVRAQRSIAQANLVATLDVVGTVDGDAVDGDRLFASSGVPNRGPSAAVQADAARSVTQRAFICGSYPVPWGDATADATLNIVDAQQLARFSVGLPVANPTAVQFAGDVTADNVVNIVDAQQVARFSVGLSAAGRTGTPLMVPQEPATVVVTPDNAVVSPSATLALTASAIDAAGNTQGTCATFTWSSSAPNIASVDASGLVTAVADGGATITATSSTRSGTAQVTVGTSPANNDVYPQTVIGNVSVNSAMIPFSVTTNDGVDASVSITFAGFGTTANVTENGGTLAMTMSGADRGKFTYDPPVGFTGTDHFTYSITVGGSTSTATVSLPVANMVWFIDNTSACAAACDGRLSHPFKTLPAFQAVNDGVGAHPKTGQTIFIYESGDAYVGPITLLNAQRLVGQDASTSLALLTGVAPPSGSAAFPVMNSGNGTRATIAGASGGIVLASAASASMYGLTVATTGGIAIASGATFGTLAFANGTTQPADVVIHNSGGAALALNTGTMSGALLTIAATGGTNNISLLTVATTGVVTLGSGAISGASSDALVITGGAGSFTYSGTITSATARAVNISNKSGGVVTLSGTITGAGVSLTSNSGAVINFSGGGLAITTTSGAGFNAIGGGTVSVTGTGNTITSTTGTALNVMSTTIGASGLTFERISADGGTNGIVLSNTGSLGGLSVTGAGGACTRTTTTCSGGVIGSTTGADAATAGSGVYLSNTAAVSLSRMRINGTHSNFGIYGTHVAGLTLSQVLMDGTYGTTVGEGTVGFDELSGSASIANSYFAGGAGDNFRVRNVEGGTTLDRITFDTDTLGFTATGSAVIAAIDVEVAAGTTKVTIQNSRFLGAFARSVNVLVNGGTADIVVQNNAFTNSQSNTSATFTHVALTADGTNATTGTVTYAIANNTFVGARRESIGVLKNHGQWNVTGTITGNVIGTPGVVGSGSQGGSGIVLLGTSQGKYKALIDSNQIYEYGGGQHAGIWAQMLDLETGATANGSMHLTIIRNTISNPNPVVDVGPNTYADGIDIVAGTAATDSYTMCLSVGNGAGNANALSASTAAHGAPVAMNAGIPENNPPLFFKLLGLVGTFTGGTGNGPIDVRVSTDNGLSGTPPNLIMVGTGSTVTSATNGAVGVGCDLF